MARPLTRRRFLTAATGATLALPALHAFAGPRDPQRTPRLLVYYLPNGRRPENWLPTDDGKQLTFPEPSAALQPFARQMIAMAGISNNAARYAAGSAHSKGTGTLLTTTTIPDLTVATNEISVDQAIAHEISAGSRFESLQWSAGEPGPCGNGGASCAYTQNLSWAGPGAPLIPTINPRAAFDRLFGSNTDGLSGADGQRRKRSLGSVLDATLDDAQDLHRRLGLADQMRLDHYFSSLRDLEQRLQGQELMCEADPQAPAAGLPYRERVDAFHELIRLAFLCDQTRVITFMLEFGLSGRVHDWVGATLGHHLLTHYASTEQYDQLVRLETWQTEQLAAMLELLATTPAHEGTLLDETVVLGLSCMGPANRHDFARLAPFLFTGSPVFQATGKRLSYGTEESLANLHVTLLAGFGVPGVFGRDGAVFGDDGDTVLAGIVA